MKREFVVTGSSSNLMKITRAKVGEARRQAAVNYVDELACHRAMRRAKRWMTNSTPGERPPTHIVENQQIALYQLQKGYYPKVVPPDPDRYIDRGRSKWGIYNGPNADPAEPNADASISTD